MRVILADDAALVRRGVGRLLEDEGFDVVAELGDADQLLDCVSRLRPDLVVVDVRMPPTHTVEGLIAAIEVKHRQPQVGVMVLSQHLETRYAVQLLSGEAGGVGYLLKSGWPTSASSPALCAGWRPAARLSTPRSSAGC